MRRTARRDIRQDRKFALFKKGNELGTRTLVELPRANHRDNSRDCDRRDVVDGTSRIMRVAVQGGPSEEVLRGRIFGLACAQDPVGSCVLAELSSDKKQLVFPSFDPVVGRGKELSRFSDEQVEQIGWDLSPDGTQVVLYREFEGGFEVLNFKNQRMTDVDAGKGIHLRTMTWAANGKGFFASNATQLAAQLIYIDLNGKSHFPWQLNGNNVFLLGKPSSDGRRLAIQTSAASSNMWMIENF